MNLREKLLSKTALKEQRVYVEEWKDDDFDGWVVVRELTGSQRDAFEASVVVQAGTRRQMNMRNVRGKLVALTLYDTEGNKIFEQADVEAVSQIGASILDRLFTIAQKLSKLSEGDIEELTKNSEATQADVIID